MALVRTKKMLIILARIVLAIVTFMGSTGLLFSFWYAHAHFWLPADFYNLSSKHFLLIDVSLVTAWLFFNLFLLSYLLDIKKIE